MMKNKRTFNFLLLAISLLWQNAGFAADFHPILNTSLGMFNLSLAENASNIKSTDTTVVSDNTSTASSSSAAIMSFDVNYEFKTYAKKSYFIKATLPMMQADGTGVFLGAIGANFYLNSMSSMFSYLDKGTSIILTPTLRYYWGASTGVGYVVYDTESAKKSDIFFDLGLHAGLVYSISQKWGIRGEGGFSRGTGVATTSTGIKFFVGSTYYFGVN